MRRGTAVRVNRALMRPRLIFGMEQKPLGFLFIICFFLLIGTKGTFFMIVPILMIIIGIILIKKLNKKDAQLVTVYIRLSRFKQAYYPPRSGCMAQMEVIKPSIATVQE